MGQEAEMADAESPSLSTAAAQIPVGRSSSSDNIIDDADLEQIVRRHAVERRRLAVDAKFADFKLVDPAMRSRGSANRRADRTAPAQHANGSVFRRNRANRKLSST